MGRDHELVQAVRHQDAHFVVKLLQKSNKSVKAKHKNSSKRVNVNFQDGDGMSGLHQAALMGNTEIMEVLLDNGADVRLRDNKGMIPLHYAAWQGKSEPVHILLQWKSPGNELAMGGESPLHLACQHGHFDVVNLLLLHHASPVILNKDKKSPLDLACEFGRYRVVDLLLRSNLCSPLLVDSPTDITDNNRTTCLHLAAKNGHQDIMRLLLQAGVSVNRTTLQGTCLHEAALFGKTEVVKLLLDCGVDVNKVNSYDQTALDIVNKFTTNRASREIKQLLKEASFSVQAKAIKDHCNIHDPNTLTFKEGDIIKIIEQKEDGIWKGSLMKEGRVAKAGYFPADHVVLIDNNVGKRNNFQIKSALISPTPEDIPDLLKRSQRSQSLHSTRTTLTSSSSYGSIGHDEAFPPPPSPVCMSKFQHENSSDPDKEIQVLPPPPPPSYNTVVNSLPQNHQPFSSKVIVNHVGEHCYVDSLEPSYQNTWDMRSPSPCKDSPAGSNRNSAAGSNRNSAASSDSGSGLSTNYLDPKLHHNYVNVHVNNHHRLSATSYESGVSSRQSYHSTSSSSVGSLDRLEESGYSSQINVAELFQAGVPDHEVLRAWLSDLHYEEYYHNFVSAGYDMPTITHMTPQDLTAIGISKPGHRKKLKAEIGRLNIHDGIPDFKPNDIYDWLKMLGLEQYYNTLANQGYDDIDSLTDIMWEDLEEIGIQKLGHQKKIMLAIDRLKRILSGAKRLSTMDGRRESAEVLEPPMTSIRWSGDRASPPPPAPPVYNELPPYLKPRRSSSGDSLSTNSSGGEKRSVNQPLESEYANTSHMQSKQAAVVPIQVKRSMSQSTPNGITEGKETGAQGKMCQSFHAPMDRTSDYSDRENTPTGDETDMAGGIPVAPRAIVKPKPVAKIIAKAKHSSRECSPDIIDIEKHEAETNNDSYNSPVKNLEGFKYPLATNGSLKRRTSENIYDIPQTGPPRSAGNYVNYPPVSMQPLPHSPGGPLYVSTQHELTRPPSGSPRGPQGSPGGRGGKKAPPPPPKRTNSVRTADMNKEGLNPTTSNALSTPPPLHPKPTMAPTPQEKAFVNCVQSLSERFGKNSTDNTGDSLSSDGEDLPPPPPPQAMDLITPKVHNYGLLGKNDKTTSGEYMLQQRLKRDSNSAANGSSGGESPFGAKLRQVQTETQSQQAQTHPNYVNIDQASAIMSQTSVQESGPKQTDSQTCVQNNLSETTAKDNAVTNELNKERKDSSGSECNASTSSLDSNTLPFANENVGTIKQRTPSGKPSLVTVLDDMGGGEESDSVFSDEMDTIRRTPNNHGNSQKMNVQNLQAQLQQQQLQQKLHQQQLKIQQQQQQLQQQHLYENAQTCKAEQRHSESSQSDQIRHPSYNASVTASFIPGKQTSPTQTARVHQTQQAQPQKTLQPQIHKTGPPTVPQKPAISPKPKTKGHAASGKTKSGDVLSEIDNMLQGLTDELDAMLEFELQE